MPYRADLSEGREGVQGVRRPVRYVGWLDEQHPVPTRETPEPFRTTLFELCSHPVNQTLGFHECPFCEKHVDGTKSAQIVSGIATGNGEIHVTGRDGRVYVAPDLIAHYVAVHGYKPPDLFVAAVLGDQHRARRRVWDLFKYEIYGVGALLIAVVIFTGVMSAMQDARQLAVEGKPASAIVVSDASLGGHRWLAVKLIGRYKQTVSVEGRSRTLLVSEPMPIGTIVPVLHVPGTPRLIVVGQPGDLPVTLYQHATGIGFTIVATIALLTCLLFGVRWLITGLKRSHE